MQSASKARWQQMTALVSLSTSGAITGFSLVPGTAAADLTSPTGTQIRLLALHQAARPAQPDDTALRSAIVNVAHYYLRMAAGKTPAEMEALIWQHDSIDGVNHGESCAAFASLTLELAAQVAGQQSWVTGGTSYPWPLHKWADVRVNPNPASPGITSVQQDAQAHGRWHPIGDGYRPLPGDWVLFQGHVEVVTSYAGGILRTVGGDSLPNFTVNAHEFANPLSAQGVIGFVNNGELAASAGLAQVTGTQLPGSTQPGPGGHGAAQHHRAAPGAAVIPGVPGAGSTSPTPAGPPPRAVVAAAAVPGTSHANGHGSRNRRHAPPHGIRPMRARADATAAAAAVAGADVPGAGVAAGAAVPQVGVPGPRPARAVAASGTAAIPGLSGTAPVVADSVSARTKYTRHQPAAALSPSADMTAQQAFISQVAPGAMATQQKYGVPAAVTIAQAIDESGWGQSYLSTKDHNLFGIKGSGPAGSDLQPTAEFENGQQVTRIASFRVYRDITQSIDDHGKLLATSSYYTQSMAARHNPDAFANALTGVYATDPTYGAKLIGLMQRYNLYRYDHAPQGAHPAPPAAGGSASAGHGGAASSGAATTGPGGTPGSVPSQRARPGGAGIPGTGQVTSPGRVRPTRLRARRRHQPRADPAHDPGARRDHQPGPGRRGPPWTGTGRQLRTDQRGQQRAARDLELRAQRDRRVPSWRGLALQGSARALVPGRRPVQGAGRTRALEAGRPPVRGPAWPASLD